MSAFGSYRRGVVVLEAPAELHQLWTSKMRPLCAEVLENSSTAVVRTGFALTASHEAVALSRRFTAEVERLLLGRSSDGGKSKQFGFSLPRFSLIRRVYGQNSKRVSFSELFVAG